MWGEGVWWWETGSRQAGRKEQETKKQARKAQPRKEATAAAVVATWNRKLIQQPCLSHRGLLYVASSLSGCQSLGASVLTTWRHAPVQATAPSATMEMLPSAWMQ